MKLSEKGYLKIGNRIVGWLENGVAKVTFDPDKTEFDQDDFEGTVCLTLDEAKTIANKLNDNSEFYFLQTGNFDFYTIELMDYLDDLIEQAEKKDE